MKSLGVIETRGWVAAIQAVDAASAEPVVIAAPEPIVPPAAPNETEDKHPALKKGKKS
ncbi:MAG: hypothetical protein E6327_25605 [Klebsiella variicola]|nr:hypothetical protein [Klebsiella variicola]